MPSLLDDDNNDHNLLAPPSLKVDGYLKQVDDDTSCFGSDGAGLHSLFTPPGKRARSRAPSPSPSRCVESEQLDDFLFRALTDDDAADEAEVAAYLLDLSDDAIKLKIRIWGGICSSLPSSLKTLGISCCYQAAQTSYVILIILKEVAVNVDIRDGHPMIQSAPIHSHCLRRYHPSTNVPALLTMSSGNGFVNNGQTSIDTYNDVAGNQHNTFIQPRDATDILKPSAVAEAAWDSAARYPAAECYEGTRTRVVDGMINWITSPESQGKMYWLTGAAGLGRSSIAHTLAKRCKGQDILGGSFFFSADDIKRNDARKLFSTLAYQLCCTSKYHNKRTTKEIKNDPSIADKGPSEQYELLIKKTVVGSSFRRPVVILDDLNEGGSDEILQGILPVLQMASQTALRFVITSQTTPIIQNFLQDHSEQIDTLNLNSQEVEVDRDIRHYYVSKFNDLSQSRRLSDWYSDQEIEQLVAISGGLFLFAAVVIKYVGEGRSRNPRARLEDVLHIDIHAMPEVRDRLDALYRRILAQIPKEDYEVTRKLMATVCLASLPLTHLDLDVLHDLESGDAWRYLQDLHAFFHVPKEDDTKSPVRLVHRFFRAFIFDSNRSHEYGIDSETHHGYLASRCLATLSKELHRNICNLPPTGLRQNAQMDALIKQRCSVSIAGALEYSSRFWYYHLRFVCDNPSQETLTALRRFWMRSIIQWIEAMSLLGRLEEAIHVVRESSLIIEMLNNTSIIQRSRNVLEAMQSEYSQILNWPLRIYDLGLAECVEDDPVAPPQAAEEPQEERATSPQPSLEWYSSPEVVPDEPLPPIFSDPECVLEPLPGPLAPQEESILSPQTPSSLDPVIQDVDDLPSLKAIHTPDMVPDLPTAPQRPLLPLHGAELPSTLIVPPHRPPLPSLRIIQPDTAPATSSPRPAVLKPTEFPPVAPPLQNLPRVEPPTSPPVVSRPAFSPLFDDRNRCPAQRLGATRLTLDPRVLPPSLPARSLENSVPKYERQSIWCIDHVASRSFKFSYSWSESGAQEHQAHLDVHVPEIQGASYEYTINLRATPPPRGWMCSKCSQLAGDLVFYPVTDSGEAVVCENCLIKESTLRSQTFMVFSWSNRHRVSDPDCIPQLRPIEPTCDDCQMLIKESGAWFHCILCRHIKSGDLVRLLIVREDNMTNLVHYPVFPLLWHAIFSSAYALSALTLLGRPDLCVLQHDP
ncbi:hypothetical protein ONZ45_g15285 [Pleurotus djamor]|nr:hypothetical protein ONZ45_g15285 [Pleurotus djamor]